MKKGFVLLATLSLTFTSCADDKPIGVEQIPAAAREFITTHFSHTGVVLATVDKELFDTSYKVAFENGDRIEFDKKGEWKEIESRNGIPESALPAQIRTYLADRHSGKYVREIDRDRRDYELKLNDGFELKFNREFQLIGIDD